MLKVPLAARCSTDLVLHGYDLIIALNSPKIEGHTLRETRWLVRRANQDHSVSFVNQSTHDWPTGEVGIFVDVILSHAPY